MNAGKSVHLLQVNHNYKQNNKNTILLTHSLDNRFGNGIIKSRLGIEHSAITVDEEFKLYNYVEYQNQLNKISCVLVDESQFFSKKHINELSDVVDFLDIPVMCYGLKSDAYGNLFEGSKVLFELSDETQEIKQICFCNRKATMVLKFDKDGNVIKDGQQIDVGAEEKYLSVCRYHWKTLKHISEKDH